MCAIQTTRSYWLTTLLSLAVLHLVRSQDTVTVTTIDDRDPAIKYNGGWVNITDDINGKSHDSTSKLSRVAGSTATFTFNGTLVSVFGNQGPNDGNTTSSTYSINNSSPSQYIVPSDVKPPDQYGVKFYFSPPLPEGEHTLKITNLNENAWYWLDYIQVSSPVDALPPISSNKSPDPTSTPSPTPTPTTDNAQQSKTGISKGVIAGIAFAGSAVIALLLLAALWWKRRHLKLADGDSTADHLHPLEGGTARGSALLEPYRVEQIASLLTIPTSSNGLKEKRTYNGVAPIRSTENNVDASHFPVDGHASDSSITQYTSERGEETSEIPPSEPSTSRPMSLSKLHPPRTGNSPSAPVSQMPPGVATPSSPSQILSLNGRSTDGGVRIAAGLPHMTREEEPGEIIDMPTLPPAYGTY